MKALRSCKKQHTNQLLTFVCIIKDKNIGPEKTSWVDLTPQPLLQIFVIDVFLLFVQVIFQWDLPSGREVLAWKDFGTSSHAYRSVANLETEALKTENQPFYNTHVIMYTFRLPAHTRKQAYNMQYIDYTKSTENRHNTIHQQAGSMMTYIRIEAFRLVVVCTNVLNLVP